jgi:hypothetical protein
MASYEKYFLAFLIISNCLHYFIILDCLEMEGKNIWH